MFFTREDIEKIHQGLLRLGIKDSELPETTNVNSDDTLAVVQDGKNKKINIEEFFNNISLFKKEGFINITDRFNKHSISLIEAIQTVPTHQRIDGLVITFEDINGDWRIYQFRGDAVDFFDENKWTDLYDYTNYIVKSITPDEEDLTVSKPDKNGNAIVSLKDRVYDESNFSGKGYKRLRKNIQTIDGVRKNILTQNMINKPNTIYVIQYDFTLGGDIIIPADCVLEFDGGSISGTYTLKGTNTGINAGLVKIFSTDVTFTGTWNIKEVYPEWFGAKDDGVTDNSEIFQKCLDSVNSLGRTIKIIGDEYRFNSTLTVNYDCELELTLTTKMYYYGTGHFIVVGNTNMGSGSGFSFKITGGVFWGFDANCGDIFHIIYLSSGRFMQVITRGGTSGFNTFHQEFVGAYYLFFNGCNVSWCVNGYNLRPYSYFDTDNNLITKGQVNEIHFDNCTASACGNVYPNQVDNPDEVNGNGFLLGGTAIFLTACTGELCNGYAIKIPNENSINGFSVNGFYYELRKERVYYIADDTYGTAKRRIHICGVHSSGDEVVKGKILIPKHLWSNKSIFIEGFYSMFYSKDINSCKVDNNFSTDIKYNLEGISLPCIISLTKKAWTKGVFNYALGMKIGQYYFAIDIPKNPLIKRIVTSIENNVILLDGVVPSEYNYCNIISKEHPLYMLGNTYLNTEQNFITDAWGIHTNRAASLYTVNNFNQGRDGFTLTSAMKSNNAALKVGDIIMFTNIGESYTTLKYIYGSHVGDYTVALNIPDAVKYHPMASMMCVLIVSTIPNNNDYFSRIQAISNRAIVTQNKLIGFNGTKAIESDGATAGVLRNGVTANRPSGSSIYVGFMYFDTSISPARPIYASAISGDVVTWVDATGATV